MAIRMQAAPQAPSTSGTTPRAAGRSVLVQTTDVGTLQSQLADLRVQLAGAQATWDGLYSQLDRMLQSNPARPGVQQQWADAGVEIARIKGEIAYREAQLARAQGRPIGTTTEIAPPPRFPIQTIDTDLVILSSTAVLLALILPISIAWGRRILRRKPEPAPAPADIAPRLESIERAVDAIAIEVERISEGQRFVTKIFANRSAQSAAPESSGAPAPAPAKALGAGPIQPVEVQERERARQRVVTPH